MNMMQMHRTLIVCLADPARHQQLHQMAVDTFQGKREELVPLVPAQLRVLQGQFRGASRQGWLPPGMYCGLGNELAVIM